MHLEEKFFHASYEVWFSFSESIYLDGLYIVKFWKWIHVDDVQEEKAKPGLTAARAEELLIVCASAIENRDVATAQQAVHALQSISSVDGELPSERVTAHFLRALMIRAGTLLQSSQNLPPELDPAQYMHDHPHRKLAHHHHP
jgi:hypothetical protein